MLRENADQIAPTTLAPLRNAAFRSIWAAQVANLGWLAQTVAISWLMATISASDLMVALVIALASIVLAISAAFGFVSPWLILGLVFIAGCGFALNDPAWHAGRRHSRQAAYSSCGDAHVCRLQHDAPHRAGVGRRVRESYTRAEARLTPERLEAINMGRGAIHDEASALLRERLRSKLEIDQDTVRRLFTLISLLVNRKFSIEAQHVRNHPSDESLLCPYGLMMSATAGGSCTSPRD